MWLKNNGKALEDSLTDFFLPQSDGHPFKWQSQLVRTMLAVTAASALYNASNPELQQKETSVKIAAESKLLMFLGSNDKW